MITFRCQSYLNHEQSNILKGWEVIIVEFVNNDGQLRFEIYIVTKISI